MKLFAVAMCAATFHVMLYTQGFLDSWQEKILDRFFLKKPAPSEIVIIAIDEESIARAGSWPWPREKFARILQRSADADIIGIDIKMSEPSQAKDDAVLANALGTIAAPVVLPTEITSQGTVISEPIDLLRASSLQGFANVFVDYDGITRKAYGVINNKPSFARVLAGTQNPPPQFRIDYRGKEKTFLTLSFADVFDGRIPKEFFRDKIVLIGATAPSFHDTVSTPFGNIPGVEFHANSVATLRMGRFYREPRAIGTLLIFFTSGAVLFLVSFLRRLTPLIFALGALLAAIFLASAFFFSSYLILPIFYLGAAHLSTSLLLLSLQYSLESTEKRFIKKTFQYYLAPEVINELAADPSRIALGGARKKITVLFSDIRGFTSLSERMTPEALTHLLNEYLSAMTDIILAERGLVDKYIGDAIMAFWGAPLVNPDGDAAACRTALNMVRRLGELNQHWKSRGLPELTIGIGINTGEVFVGNIGSRDRFNYTIIGDEVNFGSRLEGLNKAYGTNILLSESTAKNRERFSSLAVRELDHVAVKGKKEPRLIYELIVDEIPAPALKHFHAGRALYAQGAWDGAIRAFDEVLAIREDGPSRTLRARCEELKKNPPVAWTGVYEFTNK